MYKQICIYLFDFDWSESFAIQGSESLFTSQTLVAVGSVFIWELFVDINLLCALRKVEKCLKLMTA